MEQKNIPMSVRQIIQYHASNQEEQWDYQDLGQLIHLKSYSRLTYQDCEGVAIQVKWYPHHHNQETSILEIKQPEYIMVFDPNQPTYTSYLTPQGEWTLEIVTHQLTIESGRIHLKYEINLHDQQLGKYEFQLHYQG